MKKIKLWKVIILILIIGLVIFVINTIRKVAIINDMQNKISKYENSANIYSKIDSEKSTIERFIKDDIDKLIIKYKDKPVTVVQYKNESECNNYTFFEESKKVTINNVTSMDMLRVSKVGNSVSTNSVMDKIIKSITSKIYTETVNEKEYYVIDGKMNENQLLQQNALSIKAYIDKETGLTMKLVEITKENDNSKKEHITNYEYSFDSITNDKISEPSITGYEVN